MYYIIRIVCPNYLCMVANYGVHFTILRPSSHGIHIVFRILHNILPRSYQVKKNIATFDALIHIQQYSTYFFVGVLN